MRDKIEKILALQGCEGYDAIGEILSLLAPELDAARKWDRVKSYIAGECTLCPACTACMSVNYCVLNNVEYAILTEKEPT